VAAPYPGFSGSVVFVHPYRINSYPAKITMQHFSFVVNSLKLLLVN